jgi:L-threonylcarbamoyladenylate synthase
MTAQAAKVVRADDAGLAAAIAALRSGGVVAIPTDTVYGIAVGLDTPGGIERLFAVKDRPPEKAIAVLVDGLDQVDGLVDLSPAARILAEAGWPGGLTLVVALRPGARLPLALTAGTATLGVRVPDHPVPRRLAREFGPLPTTSANRSGEPDALDAAAVAANIGGSVDLIVDGGRVPGQLASTVVDCTTTRPRLLRLGAIAPEVLAAALDVAGLGHDLGDKPA